jgi:hypothetical protein
MYAPEQAADPALNEVIELTVVSGTSLLALLVSFSVTRCSEISGSDGFLVSMYVRFKAKPTTRLTKITMA